MKVEIMTDSIKKILFYVDSENVAPSAIEYAGRICTLFGASLHGVQASIRAELTVAAPVDGFATATLIDDMQRHAEERAEKAQAVFRRTVAENGWTAEWRQGDSVNMSPADEIAHMAHLSDIVVVSQQNADAVAFVAVQDIIVDSGRPVLLCPRSHSRLPDPAHVAIAWKPSREAARALQDGLPFLSRADRVTVLAATSEEKGENAEEVKNCGELCLFLKEYGIDASAEILYDVNDGDTGDALIGKAVSMETDLLIAGAYSHSRLREGLFGGVTRSLIEDTRTATLLSH